MIQINYVGYANYFPWKKKEYEWSDEECDNSISLLNDLLVIKSSPDSYEADMIITFNVNKRFIQELKALVMVMENTFSEEDEDEQ